MNLSTHVHVSQAFAWICAYRSYWIINYDRVEFEMTHLIIEQFCVYGYLYIEDFYSMVFKMVYWLNGYYQENVLLHTARAHFISTAIVHIIPVAISNSIICINDKAYSHVYLIYIIVHTIPYSTTELKVINTYLHLLHQSILPTSKSTWSSIP